MSSKGLFDAPKPIFGKEDNDNLPVATEETIVDDPDQFEDIGQTTFTVSWQTPSRPSDIRSSFIRLTVTGTKDRNSDRNDFFVQIRSGSTWQTASGWSIGPTSRGSDLIEARPANTVAAGTYRFVLRPNAFGTGKPSSNVFSSSVTIGAYVPFSASWGTITYDAAARSIYAPLMLTRLTTTFRLFSPTVQIRRGSPGSYSWSTVYSSPRQVRVGDWNVSYGPDNDLNNDPRPTTSNPAIRQVHAVFPTTSPFAESGVYRLVFPRGAYTSRLPSADIPSGTVTVTAPTWRGYWSGLVERCANGIASTLVFPSDPGSSFNATQDIEVQIRSGSFPYSWTTTSGWTFTSSGTGTSRRVTATAGDSALSGTYRLVLKRGSLASNTPDTDVATWRTADYIRNPAWGTPAYCSTSNTVTTIISFYGITTGFTDSDIQVRNSANTSIVYGWTHTITGSGSSYTVTSTPPRGLNTSFRLRLLQNSVQIGGVSGPVTNLDTAPFAIDSRKQGPEDEMPAITIDSGSFCTTSRRITWQAYITGATGPQVALLGTSDTNLNNSVSSGGNFTPTETVSRHSSGSSSYQIQTSAIPLNRVGDMSVTIRANALGNDSNPFAVTSGCVFYDTRAEVPSVIISAGNFDSDTNTVYFYAYWENTTTTALDHSTNGFTRADISVTGATGASIDLGTRMGLSYPISISNLPLNTASNLKITIRENALGTGTNIATDSSCVGYDTRPVTITPQIVIGPGNFCPTSRKLTWRVFVTNATTTQFAALTEADITVNASPNTSPVLNGTETIVERGDNSLVVEVTVPTGRNGNASITIAANALGTGTNSRAITSACVNYDTRAATVATASWGTITGGTNPMAALQGRLTFATTTNVQDIEPGDFDVIITGGTAHARASWTMQVSHDYTNSGRAYVDVTAIPNGTFNTSFGLRLRANTVRSGGSSSLNAPSANVDSALVAFDNRTTDTAPPPTIAIDGGTYCPTSKRIVWNAYVTNADNDELNAFTASDISINHARATGSAFTPTVTRTRTPSTGDSFRIETTVIPDGRSGEMSITIAANALGNGTNRSVTSGCVSYDTRTVEEPLVATWRYANYCETSDRVIAALRFNKAITGLDVRSNSRDIQIANDQKNANLTGWTLSFAGHTGSGTNASLAANTDLRITAEPPSNTNTNVYMFVNMNAVTAGTQTGPSTITYSEVIPVNNVPADPVKPSITIDSGTYCPTSKRIVWNAYITNATPTHLISFDATDITINNTIATGSSFNPTVSESETASQAASYRIQTSVIPGERSGEMSITIAANALGADTNRAVTSGCVSYDTRATADPLIGVWDYANFCETGNKVLAAITFNKAITGLNVFTSSANNGDIYIENERKQSPKDGWIFSFSGHTGTGNNASLAANTPLVIEITPPVNTNENIYLAFNANQVTYDSTKTGPDADIYTEVIAVDNRSEEDIVETPDVTISAGSFDIDTRQAYFHIYWENVTEAQLDHTINGFEAADITVSGAEGATITLGTRMGFSYPCYVTIPSGISGNVKITVLENAVGPDTNLAEDSPCIAYDTTMEATIENTPYLVVTDLPETEQTGVNFMFNFAGYLEDQQINIAGLTADDFIITAPDTGATITLS